MICLAKSQKSLQQNRFLPFIQTKVTSGYLYSVHLVNKMLTFLFFFWMYILCFKSEDSWCLFLEIKAMPLSDLRNYQKRKHVRCVLNQLLVSQKFRYLIAIPDNLLSWLFINFDDALPLHSYFVLLFPLSVSLSLFLFCFLPCLSWVSHL